MRGQDGQPRNGGYSEACQSQLEEECPHARPTFYYTNGEPRGPAKQFLDFTIGAAGQKIVQQGGFVPIK